MPSITPIIGEPFVYLMQSDRHPEMSYRVDLLENGGNGACTCVDFGTRRQPAIDTGARRHTRATMCKHVIAVRHYFVCAVLEDISSTHL
jgi:hypothetical protein